jgi:predicted ATPase
MLRSLYIQNYALIEKLDIDFGSGFSVITGETGAGKSIILGAIGLLLGQRADVKSIRRGAAKCVIIHQVNDIIFRTRKKIIQAYHVVTFVYKPCTEMRAYKTGSATYQYSFHSKYFYCLLKRRCLFVLFMVTNVTDLLKINNFRRGYFKKKKI